MTQERDIAEEATNGTPELVNNKYNSSSSRILKAGRRKTAKSEAVICIETPAHTLVPQHKLDTAQFFTNPFC